MKKKKVTASMQTQVRLLGGWKDDAGSDLARGVGCASLNASLLHARLDPILREACLRPVVVLDNVPWCFSPNASPTVYGNGAAPEDLDAYSAFLRALFAELLSRYGEPARSWYYRVGTEPNYGGHWTSGFQSKKTPQTGVSRFRKKKKKKKKKKTKKTKKKKKNERTRESASRAQATSRSTTRRSRPHEKRACGERYRLRAANR